MIVNLKTACELSIKAFDKSCQLHVTFVCGSLFYRSRLRTVNCYSINLGGGLAWTGQLLKLCQTVINHRNFCNYLENILLLQFRPRFRLRCHFACSESLSLFTMTSCPKLGHPCQYCLPNLWYKKNSWTADAYKIF